MLFHKFSDIVISKSHGILIDLDDTLYNYKIFHRCALKHVHKKIFSSFQYVDFEKLYRSARNAVTARLSPQGACRSRLFAFEYIFEQLGTKHPFIPAYEADALYWDTFIQKIVLDPAAEAFLDRCAQAELPVCIVSDMTAHVQIRKIERLGLGKRIAHLVTSEEVGTEKPDPRMFLAGMRKLGLKAPQDVIMIGDSLEKDVRGAEALGIRAYQICLTQE